VRHEHVASLDSIEARPRPWRADAQYEGRWTSWALVLSRAAFVLSRATRSAISSMRASSCSSFCVSRHARISIAMVSHWLRRQLPPAPPFHLQLRPLNSQALLECGHLACRRCHDATYRSRVCSKRLRPILQASRLNAFLRLKSHLRQHNRQRLKARIDPTPNLDFKSKRLLHYAIQHPQHNYNTCGAMPWR
jgi:hypothetical protein